MLERHLGLSVLLKRPPLTQCRRQMDVFGVYAADLYLFGLIKIHHHGSVRNSLAFYVIGASESNWEFDTLPLVPGTEL